MSGTQFTITQYGQDRIVMDYYALNDPFQQFLPIKVANNWSGTLWFVGQLNSPPAWYASYSGINLPSTTTGTNSGGIATGANATLVMSWNVNASGAAFYTSSPNTDSLTFQINAFTSGSSPTPTNVLVSGTTLPLSNVLYNRYSGVIKVFGDNYSNNQPTPSLTVVAGNGLANLQAYSYAISYFLSGWESDIGAPANATTTSGVSGALVNNDTITVSWTGIAGVTQYAVWRWSGTPDFTLAQNAPPVASGAMDLIAIVSGTSITDSGITPLQTGMYRSRSWQDSTGVEIASDSAIYLSPPSSRRRTLGLTPIVVSHVYQIGKNISGTSFLGPLYVTVHTRFGELPTTWLGLQQGAGASISTSGNIIAPTGVFDRQTLNVWNRVGFYLSGTSGVGSASSGKAIVQWGIGGTSALYYWDDVYIVAAS